MTTPYHAITLGYYQSELLRRVDPQRRTLGRFFQDEIAAPLGLDFYIRLPDDVPDDRLAVLEPANFASALADAPLKFFLGMLYPRSALRRAFAGTTISLDERRIYARNFEVPSGGGVGTARAIARAYGTFATGGRELGLRPETLRELTAAPAAPARGFHDQILKLETRFSLGFARPGPLDPFGSPSSFGHPGAGGSCGLADPELGLGYGYVMNRMGTQIPTDSRDRALREAVYRCCRRA